jgi:hypothetical protein
MKISMARRRNDTDKKKTQTRFTIRIENSVWKSYPVFPKEIYMHPRNSLDRVGSDLRKLLCLALGLFSAFNLK